MPGILLDLFSPKIAIYSETIINEKVLKVLFVKVQSDWRNSDELLETYGYKNKKR